MEFVWRLFFARKYLSYSHRHTYTCKSRIIVVWMIFKLSFALRFHLRTPLNLASVAVATTTTNTIAILILFFAKAKNRKNSQTKEEKYVLFSIYIVFYPKLLSRYTLISHTHILYEDWKRKRHGQRFTDREKDRSTSSLNRNPSYIV